jgi:hypothetical protein
MDTSDVEHAAASGQASLAEDPEVGRWREIVGEVGREIAMPLTAALERIHALTTTGRIDKAGLRALREEVEAARRAGMAAQQLTRLGSSRLRQSHEHLTLTETLRIVLRHRARETEARGIVLKPSLIPADVVADGSMLFSLLNAVLDWALQHALSEIDFSIDMKAWPAHARIVCGFAHRETAVLDDGMPAGGPQLDSLAWRLVQQTAQAMGLPLTRSIEHGRVRLTIEFPRMGPDAAEGVTAVELDQGFGLSSNSRPLAGSHVLIIASRRDMRVRVRDAIRHMGLALDLVSSVEEAADFCRDGLPHAIIVEGVLAGERLRQLRADITAEIPEFPFIEIIEEGATYAMSGFGGAPMGRVGRDAIDSALPSVLMYELSRAL